MQGSAISVTLLWSIYWISMISIMSLVSTRIQLSYQIPMESLWHRLAGVQFGSGSGVMGLNLNLHLEVRFKYLVNLHIEVRFKYLVNLNPNWRFRLKMFGPGSNNVRSRFEQCSVQVRTMFNLYRFHFLRSLRYFFLKFIQVVSHTVTEISSATTSTCIHQHQTPLAADNPMLQQAMSWQQHRDVAQLPHTRCQGIFNDMSFRPPPDRHGTTTTRVMTKPATTNTSRCSNGGGSRGSMTMCISSPYW